MQYQIRRGGNVGPTSYTVDQLKKMYAGGSLVLSDEVSPAGQNQWKPLSQAFAGGQAAAAAPAANAGAEWLKRTVAQATSGEDWLMRADLLRWIFRGSLAAAALSTFLPWLSISIGGRSQSFIGAGKDPGIIALLLCAIALGLTWVPVVRAWSFIGASLAFLLVFGTGVGIFWGVVGLAGSVMSMGGGSMGWGLGLWLCVLLLAVATASGVVAFLQHLKKQPTW